MPGDLRLFLRQVVGGELLARLGLQARRIAEYMADVTQAALLVEEAVWELANKGSARKAIVARHFASMRLGEAPVRGITSGDRTVLDYFDPIVRYQPVAL